MSLVVGLPTICIDSKLMPLKAQMYVSEPRGFVKEGQGILFIPDVLGLARSDNLV
jgi:hypothetical protein